MEELKSLHFFEVFLCVIGAFLSVGALNKRNMSGFKQQMVELEKHAEKTYLTWRNIVCELLFFMFIFQ